MYKVQKDGNAWCATGENFTNLQESPAGFGGSPIEALSQLISEEYVEKLQIATKALEAIDSAGHPKAFNARDALEWSREKATKALTELA